MLVACSQVASGRRDDTLLLGRVVDREVCEGDLVVSLKAAGVWLCAPRAALPQLMAGRRSGRLRCAAMACGNALTCEAGFFRMQPYTGVV